VESRYDGAIINGVLRDFPAPATFALVTSSFRLDLERCRLLVETVEAYVAPHVRHYVIVDRRDLPRFRVVSSARVHLLAVEDVLPWWIMRVPGIDRSWLSVRTPPIGNWIVQQLVKLSVADVVPADVLVYVDSDVFFVRPFDPRDAVRDGGVPLFCQLGAPAVNAGNDAWHRSAAQLLRLPVEKSYDTNFVGNLVSWRRENVLRLHEHVRAGGRSLVPAIARHRAFSEYVLYGMFVRQVLGAQAGHYPSADDDTLCHWSTAALDEDGLREFRRHLAPHHRAVMVSAKSRTPVTLIRKVFLA
jgi:hypothetical protein